MRIVLHLAAGQLALLNVTFLVAADKLAAGYLIIDLPLLQHFAHRHKDALGAEMCGVGRYRLLKSQELVA